MLRLRPEQLAALQAHSTRALDERLLTALRALCPEACAAAGADLAQLAAQARRTATALGITREPDLLRFLRLALLWGTDFTTSTHTAWAAEILGWKNTPLATRLEALEERSEAELQRRQR
jgi:hypothetical protein